MITIKPDYDIFITGAGKYRFVTLTQNGREVTERLPLHFFKLEPAQKELMAKGICERLSRKIRMGVVR